MHLNIRSLNINFNDIYQFLQSLLFNPDILCLSESGVKEQPLVNTDLPECNFFNVNRKRNARGVAIYISTNLKYINEEIYT